MKTIPLKLKLKEIKATKSAEAFKDIVQNKDENATEIVATGNYDIQLHPELSSAWNFLRDVLWPDLDYERDVFKAKLEKERQEDLDNFINWCEIDINRFNVEVLLTYSFNPIPPKHMLFSYYV